jgi:hypothetical protein
VEDASRTDLVASEISFVSSLFQHNSEVYKFISAAVDLSD